MKDARQRHSCKILFPVDNLEAAIISTFGSDSTIYIFGHFAFTRNLIFLSAVCGREEGKKAADCLRTALREYDLKFGTILNDPDLASFRATPEFKELQEEVS